MIDFLYSDMFSPKKLWTKLKDNFGWISSAFALKTELPTKTSDLTNDSGFITQHQDISGKADKVQSATAGNFAGLDSSGNLTDSGKKASDFATAAQGAKADTALQLHQDISHKQDKTDNSLLTTAKTVIGAINELWTKFKDYLKGIQHVTYAQLKTMRDSGTLVAGQWYRITDYMTTVANDTEARSAGHPFDLLVMATSANTLSEEAKAIKSTRDSNGYFADANLNAWKVWYCLDNDTTRFQWADTENGKGVIWRMIDEYRNDVPYDFKNIQYKRYRVLAAVRLADEMYIRTPASDAGGKWAYKSGNTIYRFNNELPEVGDVAYTTGNADSGKRVRYATPIDVIGGYRHKDGYGYGVNESDWLWAFTFGYYKDDEEVFDWTVNGNNNRQCRDNVIKAYSERESQKLNNIVICDEDGLDDDDMYGNTFGANCHDNTAWGYSFYCNSFGNDCYCNSFGNVCYSNSFGNDCYCNSFGNDCYCNSFGNVCYSNSFGNDCYCNSFGNDCYCNSFGNVCYSNSFGNDCSYNSFGNYCCCNSFGNDCDSNSFGNVCYSNSFGNECYSNSFGNECYSNSFGNDYIHYCTFGDGVQFCSIDYSTGSSNYMQYVSVLNGTRGTGSSNLLELSDLAVGVSYPQTCGFNSKGDYTVKNLLD